MTKVLIIEDSPVMRKLLTDVLLGDPRIHAVESAPDPYVAWQLIKTFKPDVITLDIALPRMDGLTFLEKLMKTQPMPVVMVSAFTSRGAHETLRALELGAVDFIEKPKVDVRTGAVAMAEELVQKVNVAATAKLRLRDRSSSSSSDSSNSRQDEAVIDSTKLIAIGASTGGTEALAELLAGLPKGIPGIVIVQHMPARYTSSFAERLNRESSIEVREARDGDAVESGQALLAPGDLHIEVRQAGGQRVVRTHEAPPVNRFRPSVDVLFRSVARHVAGDAVGVILTGMGCDGARGLLEMREAGAVTIAQDEATSVVFGMPKEAIAIGAAEYVRALPRIGHCILNAVSKNATVNA
ncbi:MAG: chemotaxis response regulator protein-glutamate methylesterase [Planctomycetota bacterium]|nr:chemotaxis response regulator protein-glutamate methylesterase [Planctomycetota bacterium]